MIYGIIYILTSAYLIRRQLVFFLLAVVTNVFVLGWLVQRFDSSNFPTFSALSIIFIYIVTAVLYTKNLIVYKRYLVFLMLFYGLFILANMLSSMYNNASLMAYLTFFRNHFHYFLVLPATVLIAEKNYIGKFFNFVLFLLLIQILLTVLQFIIPEFKSYLIIEFIIRDGKEKSNIAQQIVSGFAAIGTLQKPANLGNMLAIVIPSIYYFAKVGFINITKFKLLLFLTVLTVLLFLTGIRTSVMSLIVTFTLTFLIINSLRFNLAVITVVFFLMFFILSKDILSDSKDHTRNFDNPFYRITSVFYNDDLLSNSTLVRSNNISNYYENFLFGVGRYSKGGFYVGIESISDATLGFVFVEFGAIVLFLTFLPFTYPIYLLNKCKTVLHKDFLFSLIIFVGSLSQMITDQGLFSYFTAIPYFIIQGLLLHRNSATQRSSPIFID